MFFLKRFTVLCLCLFALESMQAQVGKYCNDLSLGVNAGYVMSDIGFVPKVSQNRYTGFTAGISAKYVCEQYFKTLCSVYGEVNISQSGWKENIVDADKQPVINTVTGLAEEYSRTLNYIQVPVFAHLAWGREHKGVQFFFQIGPQFGFLLSESTKMNFDFAQRNIAARASKMAAQDTMKVEHRFDYGIAAGFGLEYVHPKIGHFLIEGRYYYGLGNIYGDRKKDVFQKSNIGNVVIKISYLFDITKTKK